VSSKYRSSKRRANSEDLSFEVRYGGLFVSDPRISEEELQSLVSSKYRSSKRRANSEDLSFEVRYGGLFVSDPRTDKEKYNCLMYNIFMSRHLRSYQQKQFFLRIIFYCLLIVSIIYLLFSFGINLLVNTSVLIANLTSRKNTDTKQSNTDNYFYGNVDITDIPTATNTAKIYVNGSVFNFDLIEFVVNGEKFKQTKITNLVNFSEEITNLKKGDNEIYILARTKDNKHTKETKKYIVTLKDDKPKLDIIMPEDNSKTNKNEVNVTGQTDKEVYVRINELPIVADAQGFFQTSIRLKDGENKIEITAEDIAGNIEKKLLTVTYQKDE